MIRPTALCLTLLLTALPVAAEGLNGAEAAAMERYRDCIRREIVARDDGASDTRAVARAAMHGCAEEMDAMATATGEADTEARRAAFRARFESSVADTVAGFVVLWRTTQRQVRDEAAAK